MVGSSFPSVARGFEFRRVKASQKNREKGGKVRAGQQLAAGKGMA